MKPDWTLLNYLYSAGRDEADKWLSRHRASIGRRSSVDLKARFLTPEKAADRGADAGSDAPRHARKTGRRRRYSRLNITLDLRLEPLYHAAAKRHGGRP